MTNAPIAPVKHRRDIQGLRAIAVLLVALSHAGVGVLAGGFVGVDVFFVLSGFLITGLLVSGAGRGRPSFIDFYARRARRILPAATLTLVVTDIVVYRLLNFVRAKQVMHDSVSAALFTANIHFARIGTDYFAQAQPPSPVQHFWSLAVEEQFYLIWPAVALTFLGVAILPRLRRRVAPTLSRASESPARISLGSQGAQRRLLIVVLIIASISLSWSVYDTQAHQASAYFSTLTRAWELALGAALAIGAPKLMRLSAAARTLGGWLGLFAIAAASVLYSSHTAFPGYAALLPTLGAALVIGAGIVEPSGTLRVGRILALRPLTYVGDRSYTFYLWHWPVLIIAAQYTGHTLSVGTNLLLLGGALLISIITYKFFENPIRHMKWQSASSPLILWPASIVIATVVAGIIQISAENKETSVAVAALPPEHVFMSQQQISENSKAAELQLKREVAATKSNHALPAVVSSVEAARQNASIPVGLSPSPGALISDHYNYPAGCAAHSGETVSSICRLGSPSAKRSIVIIGDSHAQMWMPALLSMADHDGWTIIPIGKSACTPAQWTSPSGSPECHAWFKWAIPKAESLHPDVALITGAYGSSGASDVSTAMSAIGALTATMRHYAQHVVIIGDPPGESRQPVDCLLASSTNMNACSHTLTALQAPLDAEGAALAKGHGAGFIDTVGWFCYESKCPMVIGKTIAYSDLGHVTQTYSLELSTVFRTAFLRAVADTKAR